MKDKRQKRWKRENRAKQGTWACSYCKRRHPHGSRCPVPRNTNVPELDIALFKLGVK